MSEAHAAARAAVLGSPISHSKSPLLHTAAYRHLGVDISYTRVEVAEHEVRSFLTQQGQEPGWVGWSVTMPLKAAMVPQMTSTSRRVQTLGVLNTVVVTEEVDGGRSFHGENTDVDGIVAALQHQGITRDEAPSGTFAVLGSGGTSTAALAAAAELHFAEAVMYARNEEKAAASEPVAQRLGLALTVKPLSSLGDDIRAGLLDVVVSTLPPRAADHLVPQLPTSHDSPPVLLDVAYDPWPSELARAWSERSWSVTSGLEMLLHQAVRQVELFTENMWNPAALQNDADHFLMVRKMRSAIGLHEGAEALDR
ncbi:shikimate dehydrogenase [Nesterenkonia salmonea]|uniref:Shikimate dehydrogenase n=1 Tax=Nesterenkonia salmonea TaxID=1804987 RepID=A0A5R9BFR3_9MICC|nr:shikimate dehydrogenase [Nesterenkonia salmonea]TLP99109.1 shikimate dehydrogenase [Nesterenkonia salmonea]